MHHHWFSWWLGSEQGTCHYLKLLNSEEVSLCKILSKHLMKLTHHVRLLRYGIWFNQAGNAARQWIWTFIMKSGIRTVFVLYNSQLYYSYIFCPQTKLLRWFISLNSLPAFDSHSNSLRPIDAYMHHRTMPSLDKIVACRLFGTKPLSESMLDC